MALKEMNLLVMRTSNRLKSQEGQVVWLEDQATQVVVMNMITEITKVKRTIITNKKVIKPDSKSNTNSKTLSTEEYQTVVLLDRKSVNFNVIN